MIEVLASSCSIESSDSVSSSETYIKETKFEVNNGEEENRLWEGEEHRSKREEEGEVRVEDNEQYSHKTHFAFEGSTLKSKYCQWKGVKAVTKVERKGQTGCEGVDTLSFSDIVCGAAFISNHSQVEMSQMVIDIECEK